jgi:hypothetical protein
MTLAKDCKEASESTKEAQGQTQVLMGEVAGMHTRLLEALERVQGDTSRTLALGEQTAAEVHQTATTMQQLTGGIDSMTTGFLSKVMQMSNDASLATQAAARIAADNHREIVRDMHSSRDDYPGRSNKSQRNNSYDGDHHGDRGYATSSHVSTTSNSLKFSTSPCQTSFAHLLCLPCHSITIHSISTCPAHRLGTLHKATTPRRLPTDTSTTTRIQGGQYNSRN